ncbi:MAG: hypothetical protein EOO48_00015 [Flavobacterium sp.]|nr:MAG: hypothetical protein EOO48_00015 [Flavobacterium sp.]
MKSTFLFPRPCYRAGWFLLIPAVIAAIVLSCMNISTDELLDVKVFAILNSEIMRKPEAFTVIRNGISDEILLCLMLIGALLTGFSKLKNEDEMTAKIRYESLAWAVYVNVAVMVLATIFIYGVFYFEVLILNMFTMLFFFILRFHLKLYMLNKSMRDEE